MSEKKVVMNERSVLRLYNQRKKTVKSTPIRSPIESRSLRSNFRRSRKSHTRRRQDKRIKTNSDQSWTEWAQQKTYDTYNWGYNMLFGR